MNLFGVSGFIMKKIKITKQMIREFILLNIGVIIVAAGVYFFKLPNNFTTGGVTAISIVLSELIPINITAGTYISILNMLFLILGFIFVNKEFGAKTIYGSFLFSAVIKLFEYVIPLDGPLTEQKLLELVFAMLIPAMGTAVLFNIEGSTGGTDILAMILRKYLAVDIGKGLLISDFVIALLAGFIFGLETCLFSLLGLFLKSIMVDWVIESINSKKSMIVVTKHYDIVREYITKDLNRGATVWDVHGAYTNDEEKMILTALTRYQAKKLQLFLKRSDPSAFTVVTNTSEIYGKGFMSIKM